MVASLFRYAHRGFVGAGNPAAGGHGGRSAGVPHVVVGQGRVRTGSVGVCGRHPAVTVYVVVVGASVPMPVNHSRVGAVGRDVPCQAGHSHIRPEPQVLCCVVHASAAEEPHSFQVERHVNFVAGVGVPAVDPELVVGGVHTLHPYLVDKHVGGQLVLIAEVDHHLVLSVEVAHGSGGLTVREVVDRPCGYF